MSTRIVGSRRLVTARRVSLCGLVVVCLLAAMGFGTSVLQSTEVPEWPMDEKGAGVTSAPSPESRGRTAEPPSMEELAARVRKVYANLAFLRFLAEITGIDIPADTIVESSMSGRGSLSTHLSIGGKRLYSYKVFVRNSTNGTRRECLEIDYVNKQVRRYVESKDTPEDVRLLHRLVAEGRLSGRVSCAFGVGTVSVIGADPRQRDHYADEIILPGAYMGERMVGGEMCSVVRSKRFGATWQRPALFDELAVGTETGLIRHYRHERQKLLGFRPWMEKDDVFRIVETPKEIPDDEFQSLPPEAAGFTEVVCTAHSRHPVCIPVVEAAGAVGGPAGPRP